jgi:hypothetical protein
MRTRAEPSSFARLVRACGIAMAAHAACAAPIPRRVDFSEARRGFGPDSYDQVLASWTRHDKVVQDVGTVIELWGVYKSWEFREAYIARYADVYSLPEADRRSLFASQLESVRKTYEFHVAVQSTNYNWNDLDRPISAWKVTLVDGTGAELSSPRIEAPRLPELYESQFFPNRTEFTRTYVIRFDRADSEGSAFAGARSGRLTLRVASPVARAELVWQAK